MPYKYTKREGLRVKCSMTSHLSSDSKSLHHSQSLLKLSPSPEKIAFILFALDAVES